MKVRKSPCFYFFSGFNFFFFACVCVDGWVGVCDCENKWIRV